MQVESFLNQFNQTLKKGFAFTALSTLLWMGQPMAADTVPLNASQQKSMGFEFQPLQQATEMKSYAYQANLSLPGAHIQLLTAPMDGLVSKILRVHGEVAKDEPIIELMSPDLLKAQKDYLATLSDLKVVQQEVKRARNLIQSGVVSKKQLLASESRVTTLTQQAQQQQQDLQMMGMAEEAIAKLKQTNRLQPAILTIKAPDAGQLYDLEVSTGMRLQMNQPIAKFAELDVLVAEVFVPIAETKKLHVGQVARIGSKGVDGEIAYISHQANPMTQMIEVHCKFPNKDRNLTSGALEKIQFIEPLQAPNAFIVPLKSVIEMDGQSVVFLRSVDSADKILVQPVKRVDQADNTSVIFMQGQVPSNLSAWQVMTKGAVAMLSVVAAAQGEE